MTQQIHVPQNIGGAFPQGSQEIIVVLPDSKAVYNGSLCRFSARVCVLERTVSELIRK
jgi:hypothetical protein